MIRFLILYFIFAQFSLLINFQPLLIQGSIEENLENYSKKGINMSAILDKPAIWEYDYEYGWGLHEGYFDQIKEAGFELIRMGMTFSTHAETNGSFLIAPEFFDQTDLAIKYALDRNITMVLNFVYPEMEENMMKLTPRFYALWEQISLRYKDYSPTLIFEIINEPGFDGNNATLNSLWNEIFSKTLYIIRKNNPTRTVILPGFGWELPIALTRVNIPNNDSNIMVTIHYYDPFQFTHQDSWVEGSQAWAGTLWEGNKEEKEMISDIFTAVKNWADLNNVKIFLGEFGVINNADPASKVRWTKFIREEAERCNMDWAYYSYRNFFYDISRKKHSIIYC